MEVISQNTQLAVSSRREGMHYECMGSLQDTGNVSFLDLDFGYMKVCLIIIISVYMYGLRCHVCFILPFTKKLRKSY